MPTPRSVAEIKSKLLQPALTSHFEVQIPVPDNIQKNVLQKIGLGLNFDSQSQLNLLCCEATLPGSSLATLEINNDFTGVTERHAHRRIYDDRIDLTFYVDAQNYLPIVFFESWIKYIAGESIAVDETMRGMSSAANNYFYRVRYPKTYIVPQGLKVIKFERDYRSRLEYQFINSFPISITSMPVSYEASNLLKCTVSMTYIRYILAGPTGPVDPKPIDKIGTPSQQAYFNELNPLFGNAKFGLDTTGGLSIQSALSSGNSLQILEGGEIIGAVNANQRQVESGLPYVGRNVGPLASF